MHGVMETELAGYAVLRVLGKKNSVCPPSLRALTLLPNPTRGKQPTFGGFCLDSGLITSGSRAKCCPSDFCNSCPHNTRALSHRAAWLQPPWLHSICRHSYGALHLLISLPPLHFSKHRCHLGVHFPCCLSSRLRRRSESRLFVLH